MELYRITLSKYAKQLYAPGYPGRWNSKGIEVIYCSWSRSLACLENLVHRSNVVLSNRFSVMVIELGESVNHSIVDPVELSKNWYMTTPISYRECQMIGDSWYHKNESCLLQVPSAIIIKEFNFVINPNHPDFKNVKLVGLEDFSFDNRIFQNQL